MSILNNLKDWRGYIVWAAALVLLWLGSIDSAEFAAITAAIAVQKGAEGYARVRNA